MDDVTKRKTLSIHFGAFANPLVKQLMGLRFRLPDVGHWQKDADAIVRLRIRGFLSEAETSRARDRLSKKIVKAYNGRKK